MQQSLKPMLAFLLVIGTVTSLLFGQNQQRIDSLTTVLEVAEGSDRFNTLLELAKETQINTPSQAAEYLRQAEQFIDLDQEDDQTFKFYSYLARVKLYQHQYDSSVLIGQKALAIEHKDIDKNDRIHVFATIGTCHYYTTEFEKGIEAHLNSLRIADETENDSEKSNIYNNISVIYMAMQDWPKSEEYLSKAMELAKQTGRDDQYSRGTGNLAIVYAIQGKYELSEKMFLEDIATNERIGNKMGVSHNYNNLGQLYGEMGNPGKSLANYQKGLDLAIEIEDKSSVALGYQNVATAQVALGRYSEAEANFSKGLTMTRALNNRSFLRDGLLSISNFYEQQGKSAQALDYYKQYTNLNDSLLNESRVKAIEELQTQYETEKKEKEILSLSEKELKNKASLARQKTWIIGLLAGLVFLVGYFYNRMKVSKQRAENQKQKALIEAITETQIGERKRIAQDLHDSIGAMIALTTSQLKTKVTEHNIEPQLLEEPMGLLKKTADQVRNISHNMMPGELMKFGLVSAIQTTLDNINDEVVETSLHTHNMEKRIDEVKEIHIYRIFQEAVQNVLKHAKAKHLAVYLNKYAEYLSIMIEDDGKGFKKGEYEEGIGLKNIKTRIEYLDGLLEIDSNRGAGTTFNIRIPI